MSETVRTIDDIRNEYSQAAAKLGHVTYQIEQLSKDAAVLTGQMRDLNLEATTLPQPKVEAT